MSRNGLSVIVAGTINTDITVLGVKKFLGSGEYTHARELKIGPGGKSRNIAQMISSLIGSNNVAMIGKTVKDPYGFWKTPISALKKAGVNCDYIKIESFKKTQQLPGIAIIPVNDRGNNQIYVVPGISDLFSPEDIDLANYAFEEVKNNNGLLVLSLELPLATAIHAVKKANKLGIKVFLDPGGIQEEKNYSDLLSSDIYLIKPNEHEAKILTGIKVIDFESAQKAAQKLLNMGIKNIMITCGSRGAYLFNKDLSEFIQIPNIEKKNAIKDETGCGDETIAATAFMLLEGYELKNAVKMGVLAGTLKFNKPGIAPVKKNELMKYSNQFTSC